MPESGRLVPKFRMPADPGSRIAAERDHLQAFAARHLHHRLHQAAGRTGAAQCGRRLDMGDDEVGTLPPVVGEDDHRSEEHTSELQSLMRISYAVFCLKTNNL